MTDAPPPTEPEPDFEINDDAVVVTTTTPVDHVVEKSGIPVYLPDGNRFARAVISDGGHYIELFIPDDEKAGAIAGLMSEGLMGLDVTYLNAEARDALDPAVQQGEQR